MSTDGQGRPIKRPRKIVENFNRLSGVHERYRWGGALLPHTIPGSTGARGAIASPRQTAAGQKNHVDRPIKNRFYQSYRMHQNSPFELSNQKILWGPLLVGRGHPFPTQYPLGVNSLSHLLMSYCFLNTVTHFMVVVLHLGLFDVRTKNTTQKERLVPKSVTLNDLERRNGLYFALFYRIR